MVNNLDLDNHEEVPPTNKRFWGSVVLSFVIIVAFGVMIFVVLMRTVPNENQALANVLLGTLTALAVQVGNYWLGSSAASEHKDATIANAQAEIRTANRARYLLVDELQKKESINKGQ